jgi:hypothetical protein
MSAKQPPLWTCPNCGRPFANRNQEHSCGDFTVEAFLKCKGANALAMYHRFVERVEACGPVIVAPAKTRIGFQVRMIFAAVNKLTDKQLDAHVVLTRRLDNPRFRRIEMMTPTCYVYHFRIHTPDDLDDEVAEWLREAYVVGTQVHLSK